MERIIQNYQEKLDSVTSNYQVNRGSNMFMADNNILQNLAKFPKFATL